MLMLFTFRASCRWLVPFLVHGWCLGGKMLGGWEVGRTEGA